MRDIIKSEKVILLDLGNILVRLNSVDKFWSGQTSAPGAASYQQRWISSQAVRDLETGRIKDFYQFYKRALLEFELEMEFSVFSQIFISLIGEKFEQTDYLLSELAHHYRLMLLSDTSDVHWQYCRNELLLGKYFERVFLSYEIGFMKPDRRIFETVLADINVIPQNIYYFDDKSENVDMGNKLGINSYKTWGGSPLIDQMKQLKLLDYIS